MDSPNIAIPSIAKTPIFTGFYMIMREGGGGGDGR